MKALNITLIIAIMLISVGVIAYTNNENNKPATITIESMDSEVFIVEDNIIYVLEGTIQSDVLNNLTATDSSTQSYQITTSEGSNKSLSEIYEYDRLYVTAENGSNSIYYTFRYTDSLSE